MNPDILNDGLYLAMEWGQHWLQPIQPRLAALHPELGAEALDGYNAACREAMRFGFDLVDETLKKAWAARGWQRLDDINSTQVQPSFEAAMRARHPWVNAANLGRLFSQGMYYALK